MWEGDGGRAAGGKVSIRHVLGDGGAYKVHKHTEADLHMYRFTYGSVVNSPRCSKVRYEAEESLGPRGETGGQTAGRPVVRMSLLRSCNIYNRTPREACLGDDLWGFYILILGLAFASPPHQFPMPRPPVLANVPSEEGPRTEILQSAAGLL